MASEKSHVADPNSARAESWRTGDVTLRFSRRPMLMGIVNVTPDSFSDGGRFFGPAPDDVSKGERRFDPAVAVEHGLRLASEGADLIDVGGESTRPYSQPVDEDEELRRIVPVVSALCRQTHVPVSIDTSKARVAEAAIDAGVRIINDVTGLEGDRRMIDVARRTSAGVCIMHMQGTPQTMQDAPAYVDVVLEVYGYLRERRDALLESGIDPRRICLDPGIGFGKTHQHNLSLLAGCGRLHALLCPLLVGPSRKGFIAKVLGPNEPGCLPVRCTQTGLPGVATSNSEPGCLPGQATSNSEPGCLPGVVTTGSASERTAGTVGVALALAAAGVQILRVHDVRPVREALLLFEAAGGIDGQAVRLDES